MARLATIDEAQKKIDSLTTNMVSLQELLGDKRSRGAFGEVQLEALVRNILPASAYTMQHTLSNGQPGRLRVAAAAADRHGGRGFKISRWKIFIACSTAMRMKPAGHWRKSNSRRT